ncbi:unnamed protein product [Chrysoparadoxa australica]
MSLRGSHAHKENHFDYLVIGGGSGGVSSSRRAASHGAKVALVEATTTMGGTCVNVGCVPKKVMWNTANVMEVIHSSKHYGYDVKDYAFDWGKIKELRDNYVKKLNGIYSRNLDNSGITTITGTASFVGPKTVAVEGVEYTADHILIATGGKPAMPDIPGIELCISSNGFFELETQPSRVAVVGAGYIAVEMAGIFNALGTNTHLFVRGQAALRRFDPMLTETLKAEMAKSGLHLHPGSTPAAVKQDDSTGQLTLVLEGGEEVGGFDTILMAIGREPLLEPLNLEAAGVKLTSKGYIEADEYQNTAIEGVYALGDVCGKVELTPMAIAAGRKLSDRLFAGLKDGKADYDMVCSAIFSHPPIGTCGLTEPEAIEKFGEDNIRIYKSTFVNLFFGHWPIPPEDKQKTACKVICTGPEQKVVGLHIIGMAADEILQGFGVAMKMGATKQDLDSCVAIHPTAAEELVTLAPWQEVKPSK